MQASRFENAPLGSLFRDKEIVEALKGSVDTLKSDLAKSAGVGLNEGLAANIGVEAMSEQLDKLLDKQESVPGSFGEQEAIVLLTGRPPLLIQDGKWEQPRIAEIGSRLEAARSELELAIPKVGRIELLNSPGVPFVGTGWMIDEDVMITNRHVAREFAFKQGDTILLRTTPFGSPLEVQVDFNEEHESPNPPMEFAIGRVLFIEDDLPGQPDMALIKLNAQDGLPEPIELSRLRVERDDDVAVIGYPARDAGRNDPFVMAELFRNIYDVKRLSPGRVSGVRSDRFILTHDCTTLGGNSGSVVLNLKDGKAAGLHFAGSFRENNFAVTSETIREKLSDLGRRLVVAVPDTIAPTEAVPTKEELTSRIGYEPDFLGVNVPVPEITGDFQLAPVEGRDDNLLHYLHFSVAMNKQRRLAMYTACNIDGAKLFGIRRGRDKWNLDPRMSDEFQVGNELYKRNPLDRGHLVRRLDPAWGNTREEAVQAADDTFFYTNSTPQHSRLNQREWLRLEEYILDNAATHDLKVSVFTGPVFAERDREYRGVQLPEEYWKVIVIVNTFTNELSATAYLLSQSEFVEDLEFVFGEFKTYQVQIRMLEKKIGLSFGTLSRHDPLDTIESTGTRNIDGRSSIIL